MGCHAYPWQRTIVTRPVAYAKDLIQSQKRCDGGVRRSLLTQEGICLRLQPDFHFLEVAYPYVARRLLTDEDPALRERLFQVRRVSPYVGALLLHASSMRVC